MTCAYSSVSIKSNTAMLCDPAIKGTETKPIFSKEKPGSAGHKLIVNGNTI